MSVRQKLLNILNEQEPEEEPDEDSSGKLDNSTLRFRRTDHPTLRCTNCHHFGPVNGIQVGEIDDSCVLLKGPVGPGRICDGFHPKEDGESGLPRDSVALGRGLVETQAFQLKVVKIIPESPIGLLLVVEDNHPNPHRYGAPMDSIVSVLASFGWSQADVNLIETEGRNDRQSALKRGAPQLMRPTASRTNET